MQSGAGDIFKKVFNIKILNLYLVFCSIWRGRMNDIYGKINIFFTIRFASSILKLFSDFLKLEV